MIHLNPKIALTALVLAMGSPALTACSDASPTGVEQAGTLTAALLTSGSDGLTYQFPLGTTIRLTQGNFDDSFPLDGEETVLTVRLPVGTYNVQLQFPTATPQLRRTNNMGVTTLVDATWLDLQPVTVPIGTDLFTDLVLHFQVSGLGNVSFDMGNLAVALDVQKNTTTQPAQLFASGTYIHNFQLFGSTATMGAQTYFAQVAGEPHGQFLDFNLTGPWTQRNEQTICSDNSRLDAFTTQDGESGYSRATNLLIGQIGTVCIVDTGASDQFFVNTNLAGPAPAGLESILPAGNYNYFLHVSGFIGDIYDGRTLQQARLENFTVINGGLIAHQIRDLTINQDTLYQEGFLSGSMRLVP